MTHPIECHPLPDRRTFYATYASARRPVLFSGGLEHWPAARQWSLSWFEQAHGDVVVPVHLGLYQRGRRPGTAERVGESKPMPLRDYIAELRQDGRSRSGYLAGAEIYGLVPSLLRDLAFPDYASLDALRQPSFWLGGAGTITQLHMDKAQNLYAQLVGRKRWRLYAPERRALTGELPVAWSHSQSVIDLEPERFEERARAAGLEPDYDFIIESGQMLFLPYGWWHRVETVEPSIAANLWWWTPLMVLQRAPSILKERLLGSAYEPSLPAARAG
jgi:hypothetical protein